jgi:hypothetical protein
LREMAKMIGVSPTYLSKIERDEFPPPAECTLSSVSSSTTPTSCLAFHAIPSVTPISSAQLAVHPSADPGLFRSSMSLRSAATSKR